MLVAGTVIPFAAVCLWAWRMGVFGPFWFWTFTYARLYATGAGEVGWGTIAAHGVPLILGAVAIGAILVEFRRPERPMETAFILGLLAFSILVLLPGFTFRRHYFVLVLSGLGLMLFLERSYLFEATPAAAARMTYGVNPFPEAPAIAAEVARRTHPGDRIAIFGSEPEILFYAGRRSATGYVYMYELMEEHPFAEQMQREMIAEIGRSAPAMIVDVRVEPSWSPRPHSPRLLFDWFAGATGGYDLLQTLPIAGAPDQFVRLYGRKGAR